MSMMIRWDEEQLRKHMERMAKTHPARDVIGIASARSSVPHIKRAEPQPEPAAPKAKRAKHGSISITFQGERFDSKLEFAEWEKLKAREALGEIRNLRRQVKFSLFGAHGEHIGVYKSDFCFEEIDANGKWVFVVADAKSPHTKALPAWPRTKKLFTACHGYEIRELP